MLKLLIQRFYMTKPTAYDKKLAEIERIQKNTECKIEKLKSEAVNLRSREIKPVMRKILDYMARYEITVDDIQEAARVANSFRKRSKGIKLRGHLNSSAGGRKLPPKYYDPSTGNKWSGRGKLPKWLRDAEKGGRNREIFLVAK